ncbi:hypothetical protein [Actinoplanes solisilvae]|uniref:hypothetical protein n=1 Tax=Actinoplanes solisilvae TaxID=2486853 RepID=UPI000FD77BF9|nr:hypothetical protein [Actinoplanes solisilvae]
MDIVVPLGQQAHRAAVLAGCDLVAQQAGDQRALKTARLRRGIGPRGLGVRVGPATRSRAGVNPDAGEPS